MSDHAWAGIELVVLDVHGVVLNRPWYQFLDDLAVSTGQDPDEVVDRWHRDFRLAFWSGRIGESELWEGLAGPRHAAKDWRGDLEGRFRVTELGRQLSARTSAVTVWALSNHRDSWLRPRLGRFGLLPCFSRVMVSDVLGAAKPDPAVFAPILEAFAPERVLFVDDRDTNRAAARELGMAAEPPATLMRLWNGTSPLGRGTG